MRRFFRWSIKPLIVIVTTAGIVLLTVASSTPQQEEKVQVKIIKEENDYGELERRVNEFLESISDYEIIKMDYQLSTMGGWGTLNKQVASVMIVYKSHYQLE